MPPGETDWSKAYTQPAFYYQDFIKESHPTVNVGQDWYYPNGNWFWKIRFSPITTGNWQYRIVATDAGGSVISPIQNFSVTSPDPNSSSRHGFVRVSSKDPRYFELSDGTYFPALGYNMNYDHVNWVNPEAPVSYYSSTYNNNPDNFAKMGQNGIQLVRMWLSEWSIFGAGWNPWKAENGASNDPPWNWLDLQPGSNPASEFAVLVGQSNRCMIYGINTYHPAVKPNTTYRFRLNYQIQNFSGSGNYGLAIRLSGDTSNCGNNANLTSAVNILPSYPHTATATWQTIDGTYTTKSNEYFLPYIFVAADNISSGWASFRWLTIQEVLPNNQFGTNILPKPMMDHHLYFDQRQSFAFDKVVELAKANGVYLRPVILDHREETLNMIDPNYGVYGSSTDYSISRVRWLETQWYRYLQARWGYSTAIHSWEFVNEGDPGRTWFAADYAGRYFHGHYLNGSFDPNKYFANWHLSGSSVWAGSIEGAGSDIDMKDFHQYIPSTDPDFLDTARATYNASMTNTGANQPVIRGETGLTQSGTQPGLSDLQTRDPMAVWLHNFIWGGINSGAVIESYWYESYPYGHIYTTGYDHRNEYGNYYRFIKDIPLNNGNYVKAITTVGEVQNGMKVWGQKDLVNNRAHLWIANNNYRWENRSPAPVSGNITISGFSPNIPLKIEWWNTYSGVPTSTTSATTNGSGILTLNVNNLVTDTAVKIGDYTISPTITVSPTSPPIGDLNSDGRIDLVDLVILLRNYRQVSSLADLNRDSSVNLVDAAILIANLGK